YPLKQRTASRLLQLDKNTGEMTHYHFADLTQLLKPNDLLVFNNTRVIPARLFGAKASGGKVEILVERIINTHTVLAHVRASKSPKPGSQMILQPSLTVAVRSRAGELFELEFLDPRS